MTTPAPPIRLQPVTALKALLDGLRRFGWVPATPTDPYTEAAGVAWYEPARPKRTGHTPARLTVAGDVLALGTFDRQGRAMDQVSWSWVDPGNVHRIHDYVTRALEDAKAERGDSW